MAVRFVIVTLLLVMVCGIPTEKKYADVAVFEEILNANEVADFDFEDILKAIAKQCQCQETKCLCCDSISVFGKAVDVCLTVKHASGMFTLNLQVSGKRIWEDALTDSSARDLIGKSPTVPISCDMYGVKGSGKMTFHDIQMTPKNVASSCVDGNAVLEYKGRSQSVKFNLGCFIV